MAEPVPVREIRRNDRDRWAPLWDGYNRFYGRSGPTALDPAITETTWNRFFDPEEPVFAFVAEAGGELLGLVHYLFHRSTTQVAPTCYLQDLFTSEDARRRGVGAALIEAVYAAAKAKGCARVYWQTHETNAVARALYDRIAERSGFIVYARAL
ncbi:MAG TPA: GNAT family N-acetyltransferase [Caulobacteraceae bacterium]|nr:GNAT family N-acetyltransferase [Caulobacteraceae bacterium]